MTRIHEPLHSLVEALRALLETAGPQAEAFLRDWPRELIARPVDERSLPSSPRFGVSRDRRRPKTRGLVEAVEALGGELDWRQTYTAPISASVPQKLRL